MCIHCRRLRRTPCPAIPYSCPHCPVKTISSCCMLIAKPSDPCDTLPLRWLKVNRRVIYALAEKMGRSPTATHYGVLRLLYSNYGNVIMISRKRQHFSRFPNQDLFSAGGSLFDYRGCLIDPMAPDTLGKLLRMMQDYIFRLKLLNQKYKWYGNGEDRGEILPLLGEQDELVRLLRALFGNSYAGPVSQLLQALNTLDFNSLFGKLRSSTQLKSISDLYSEVVAPSRPRNHFGNQIEEVTIHDVVP